MRSVFTLRKLLLLVLVMIIFVAGVAMITGFKKANKREKIFVEAPTVYVTMQTFPPQGYTKNTQPVVGEDNE